MSRNEIEFEYAMQGEGRFEAVRRLRRATETLLRTGRAKLGARRERDERQAADVADVRRARHAS